MLCWTHPVHARRMWSWWSTHQRARWGSSATIRSRPCGAWCKSFDAEDRVRIFAADVRANELNETFVAAGQAEEAIAKLKKRLPLGNTNMLSVISSVRAALVAEPSNHTRSIVYIGDGSSIDALGNEKRFGALIGALRADRIAVHSIAIGPALNIELMAILANQTGGVLGVVGETDPTNASAIGAGVGDSAMMSPIWLTEAKLLAGMNSIQADRLPPLRLDRDSILLGSLDRASRRSGPRGRLAVDR